MSSTTLGTSGVNVISWPLTRPENSRNGGKVVMIFFNDSPVASCMDLDTASAVITTVKCASIALLDMPQVVITADYLSSRHDIGEDVRDITFEPGQLHRPLIRPQRSPPSLLLDWRGDRQQPHSCSTQLSTV
ncbi:hypothetical protein [Brevibacterium sp. JSBI002]|uniref:hypothetical protein n=1 Tax=Brevibacterium sp. JSBI002 TaxID=2886045 RepID=UPI00222FEF13|nr:hypothetical protein [Brevibacterium sp. JSBI002]UZD62658.1 hypothetical protein LJ362_01945 [Brevibacterium sp. JSBI002]